MTDVTKIPINFVPRLIDGFEPNIIEEIAHHMAWSMYTAANTVNMAVLVNTEEQRAALIKSIHDKLVEMHSRPPANTTYTVMVDRIVHEATGSKVIVQVIEDTDAWCGGIFLGMTLDTVVICDAAKVTHIGKWFESAIFATVYSKGQIRIYTSGDYLDLLKSIKPVEPEPEAGKPTEEGKLRYPPNGYYEVEDPGSPCTCKSECPQSCKGECGCQACSDSYQDFLSCE